MQVGAFVEKEAQQIYRGRVAGGDEQWRAAGGGASGIHVGPAGDEQSGFLQVGHGPHKCGGAIVGGGVGARAAVEQKLDAVRAGEQCRRQQRRNAVGVAGAGAGSAIEQMLHGRSVSAADGIKERIG